MVGVPNVRLGRWTQTVPYYGMCRAWPGPMKDASGKEIKGVEGPEKFGHPDCLTCARFTRNPDAPTKE